MKQIRIYLLISLIFLPAAVSLAQEEEAVDSMKRVTVFGAKEEVGTTPGSGAFLDTEDIRRERILRRNAIDTDANRRRQQTGW